MAPRHKGRGQMYTRKAVMYDDSNLTKNVFNGVVSFAVNLHFFRRELVLCWTVRLPPHSAVSLH